ncbi:MAG: MBG domain-containing protein, partial [Mucilaginibacter sp.]
FVLLYQAVAAAAPVITSFSPASGTVGTLVTINGTGLSSPSSFNICGKPAVVVSNNGTKLMGMVMPGAISGSITITTAGGTASAGGSFTVNAPAAIPIAKEIFNIGTELDPEKAYDISVSADGTTAAIPSSQDNNQQGGVWIYVRSGDTWVRQGNKLVGTGNTGPAWQGYEVALSADGNTLLSSGPQDNGLHGAVWVFSRLNGVWIQQAILKANDEVSLGYQGLGIALSADGNTAIVGGPWDNSNVGAVWTYVRTGNTWTQQGSKLTVSDNIGNARFGFSVAISADGHTLIAGGASDNNDIGATWVFTNNNNNNWIQQGPKLVGSGVVGSQAYQGGNVSLSADGNTALIGGYLDNNRNGATWVFTRTGTTWAQQGNKLIGDLNNLFDLSYEGESVSLSADGNIALIGGYGTDGFGAAWSFARKNGIWTQQGPRIYDKDEQQGFGDGVALTSDGKYAFISKSGGAKIYSLNTPAPQILSLTPSSGPVGTVVTMTGTDLWATTAIKLGSNSALLTSVTDTKISFMIMPGTSTNQVSLTTPAGTITSSQKFTVTATPYPIQQQGAKLVAPNTGTQLQGNSVAVSADGNTAIIGAPADKEKIGSAWVYVRSVSGAWTRQSGRLIAGDISGSPEFGSSAAISANGNTVVIGAPANANTSKGAAWVFNRKGTNWEQYGLRIGASFTFPPASLGAGVSISADGNTLAMLGSTDNSGIGAVWIFTFQRGGWRQQGGKLVGTGYITSSDAATNQSYSTALSADGNTLLFGRGSDNNKQGALWVFTRSGNTWTQQGNKIIATGNTGAAQLGFSVALSADGNTAVAGGKTNNNGTGAMWVFTRNGTIWTQQGGSLLGTGSAGVANQGTAVSLSADGNTAVSGGNLDNNGIGASWVFTRSGNTWTQQGEKRVGTGSVGKANQGISVALSADGTTLLSGGNTDNNSIGAAWAFGITRKSQTVTLSGNATGLPVYGMPDITPTVSASSGLPVTLSSSNTSIATIVNGKVHIVGAGTVTITATQPGNYEYLPASKSVTVPIGKRPLIVKVGTQYGLQGYPLPKFIFTYTGFINGDTVTSVTTLPVASTMATNSSPAGNYPLTISGGTSAKYNLSYVNGTFTIAPVSYFTAPLPVKTYGDADFYEFGINVPNATFTSSDPSVATIVNGKIHIKGAGTTSISTQNGSLGISKPLTVNKAVLTVTAINQSKVSGTANPPLSYTIGGFVNGDNPNSLIKKPAISTTATTSSPAGSYPITVNGGSSFNYAFKYVNASLTVNPATSITVPTTAMYEPIVQQALSPNGDDINDILLIGNIERYADNQLSIVNSKGVSVFNITGYDNISKVFNGRAGTGGKMLQPGTYFYKLQYRVEGVLKSKNGYFIIKY